MSLGVRGSKTDWSDLRVPYRNYEGPEVTFASLGSGPMGNPKLPAIRA
jgi:hypothetical protein